MSYQQLGVEASALWGGRSSSTTTTDDIGHLTRLLAPVGGDGEAGGGTTVGPGQEAGGGAEVVLAAGVGKGKGEMQVGRGNSTGDQAQWQRRDAGAGGVTGQEENGMDVDQEGGVQGGDELPPPPPPQQQQQQQQGRSIRVSAREELRRRLIEVCAPFRQHFIAPMLV